MNIQKESLGSLSWKLFQLFALFALYNAAIYALAFYDVRPWLTVAASLTAALVCNKAVVEL